MTTIAGYPCTVRRLNADEGGGFRVAFPDLPGCMSDGDTITEAKENATEAVASYLTSCRKHDDAIPAPGSGDSASGKFLVRLPKILHVALAERAKVEGVSMNHMLTAIVSEGLGRRTAGHKPSTLMPISQSLSFAQAHLAKIISAVNSTRQSVVVTRRGVRVAVIQDFDSYRRTEDALLMLKLVAMGEADIAKGRSRSNADVFRSLRRRLKARSAAQSKASRRS
jgi:antitoxin HicB